MKTGDAFAFKDFDPARVFQRPLFRQFNFPAVSDEKILEKFDVWNFLDLMTAEERLKILGELKKALARNAKLILNQVRRLDKILPSTADGIIRLFLLKQCYGTALGFVGNLQSLVNRLSLNGEKALDRKRRWEFTRRLKSAREAAGLSQLDLALKLNVSATGYASWEQNRTEPSVPMLIKICKELEISSPELLGV